MSSPLDSALAMLDDSQPSRRYSPRAPGQSGPLSSALDLLGSGGQEDEEESLISRAAKGLFRGAQTVGHVVGTPFRGLGMAGEELRAAATGEPSRIKLTPEGEVVSPTLPQIALEGYKAAAQAAGGVADVREPGAIRTMAPEAERTFQAAHPILSRTEAVAEPVAELGLQFATDPSLVGLGALGNLARTGRMTARALEAGGAGMVPDAALTAAAQKAVLMGKAAGAAERGIGASFVPGMVEGAVHAGREFMRVGGEEGYTSPAALRAGTQAAIDAAMAGLTGYHAVHPTLPAGVDIAEAAAQGRDREVSEQAGLERSVRAFQTPDIEAAATALAARDLRQQLEERRTAEEATAQQQEAFFTPDLEAAANAETARLARERRQAEPVRRAVAEATGPGGPPRLTGEPAFTGPGADLVNLSPEAAAAGGVAPAPAVGDIAMAAARARRREALARAEAAQEPPGAPQPTPEARPAEPPPPVPAPPEPAPPEPAPPAPVVEARPPREPIVGEPVPGKPPEPAPAPSPAQMEAGNYTKGHRKWAGLDIAVETAKGGERVAKDGSWRVPDYPADYGYVKRTKGKDGDQVDVFMGDAPQSRQVFVIDQINPDTGKFDEHKAMLGFADQASAIDTYQRAYTDGRAPERIGAVTTMSVDAFKKWVRRGNTKKPLSFSERETAAPRPGPQGTTGVEAAAGAGVQPPPPSPIEQPRGPSEPPGRAPAPVGAPGAPGAQAGTGEGGTSLPPTGGAPGVAAPEAPPATVPPARPERRGPERLAGSFHDWHQTFRDLPPERQQAALSQLHDTAYRDPLTELPNRAAFIVADGAPDNAGRQRVSWDVEGLKWANDTFGHDAGDRVLQAVGQAMRDEGLEAYRVGGDEFWSLSGTPKEAQAQIDAVNRRLADATITVETPDGQRKTFRGIRAWASHGPGVADAERGLLAVKADAVRSGQRAGRGERPRSLLEVPPAGEPDRGREPPAPPVPEAPPEVAPPPPPPAAPPPKKPVTPQLAEVPGGGTKYTLPSFVTEQYRLPQKEYQRLKADLTRAINSKDNRKILETAEAGLKRFEETGHPDDWSHWERAKDDALSALQREGEALPALAPAAEGKAGTGKLVDEVARRLEAGESIPDNRALQALAQEAFGGTRGQGKYTPRDAYDALEAGVNRWVESNGKRLMDMEPQAALKEIRGLLKRLPTQTDRTKEQVERQQFSTPPTHALVVAKALAAREGEVVLEPSAGVGGLAVIPRALGADVHVNEIAPRRLELLKALGFKPTSVDAENLHDVLPDEIRPTAIVMNPPFSATGGRVTAHKTIFGARHVEQALQRLEPGGRLVAIVGQGMKFPSEAPGMAEVTPINKRQAEFLEGLGFKKAGTSFLAPLTPEIKTALGEQAIAYGVRPGTKARRGEATGEAFREWWGDTMGKYNVRANLELPGEEYGKYGTTFGNQLLVIDKNGATPGAGFNERLANVAHGRMVSLEQALDALRPIAADRGTPTASPRPLEEAPSGALGGGLGSVLPSGRGAEAAPGGGGERPGPGRAAGLDLDTARAGRPGEVPPGVPGEEPRPQPQPAAEAGAVPGGGGRPEDVRGGVEPPTAAAPAKPGAPVTREEVPGGTFVRYKPAKLAREGLAEHPANIVEAASMAAIDPPDITYKSALPQEILKSGKLSDIQYESVLYAGQRHEQRLPDGKRAGYFVGDGTGVGKGRIIAGILVDNFRQGRKRALWLSVSNDLMESSQRDLRDLGAQDLPLKRINEYAAAGAIEQPHGVVFSTYNSLIARARGEKGQTRLNQLQKWLGDDGVIVFDEAHKAKNALAEGQGEPTLTGKAVIDIQNNLPGARVVYVSATGATDVRNMAYMTRLGLWGKGTSFPAGFGQFLAEIGKGGVGAMEMAARDLKALGMYNSRSLSFEGVEYREAIHELPTEQVKMYDTAADAWQVVLKNIDKAIDATGGGSQQRRHAMTRFWGDQQRFMRQFITALKVPSAIRETEKALAEGKSVVLGLIGTGESQTARKAGTAIAEGGTLDDIDFTPREVLAAFVDKAFPTEKWTEETDPDTGKTVRVPLVDAQGKPVHSKEALALKQELIDRLSDIALPENPLDQIVNHFGPAKVAELTGRKRRLERNPKNGKLEYAKRAPEGVAMSRTNVHEMEQFQKGKKRIAIISDAASTGISLHSSNREPNKQRRVHITLELGWSADRQMQTFGRTHRSDEASPPEYVLLSSNIGGEKRFSSTVARRLSSLGALTKGQRDATGGGDLAKYNFETPEGETALQKVYGRMMRENSLPGLDAPYKALEDMGVLRSDGSIAPNDLNNVPRFLNRVLALDVGRQNAVFDEFVRQFDESIRHAKETGTFDEGVADIKGEAIRVKGEPEVIHKDETTGAETFHYTLEVDRKTNAIPWKDISKRLDQDIEDRAEVVGFSIQKHSGRIVYAKRGPMATRAKTGEVYSTMTITTPKGRTERMAEAEFDEKFEHFNRPGSIEREARPAWEEAVKKIPKVETEEVHVIGGAILPLWERLKAAGAERLRVVRATAKDGRRVVGVEIPQEDVGKVLKEIGISRSLRTPEEVFKGVWNEGDSVNLVTGLSVRKARVRGEDRIEVTGADSYKFRELRDMGLINEQIDYKQRFFVPSEEGAGVETLKKLLERYPASEEAGGGEAAAALDRLKKRGKGSAYSMGAAAGAGAETWRDATIYGAGLVDRGIRRFADWSARMTQDLGDTIGDLGRYLRSLYARSTTRAGAPPRPPVGGTAAAAAPTPPRPGPEARTHVPLAEDAVTASNRAKKIADTFEAQNRKFDIALGGAERIQERGTIEAGDREAFRRAGQPSAEETRGFRFSEADIEQAGSEIVAAAKEFQDAERRFREGADPESAYSMRLARQIMEQAVKNWQVYRSAAGRAVKKFDRPIPEEVIQRLREAGLIAGNLRDVRNRAPIASNILHGLRNWKTLTDAEKKAFARDLVDHFRLNLFSVSSWTLDAVGNAAELAGQAGAGLGRDLVHVVKGNPTFPSMQGLFRAIRAQGSLAEMIARRSVTKPLSPDVEARLGTTQHGERLRREEGAGTFTYRKGFASKAYDYTVGWPLYAKAAMDTAAKRMGTHWTLYREAIEAAHRQGIAGADRQAFFDDFLQNPPRESLERAIANGNKAGFNRDLSKLEEKVASSTTARLLVDVFARWPFQFTRWAGEMLGWNPEMYHRLRAGTLRAEDVGEYLGKAAVGLGGLYLINNMFYNRTDFNSMEYVDDEGNRIRLSNRDPIPTALWFLALLHGDAAKATAALRHASVPGARLLAGEGGLLGGTIKVMLQAIENPQNDPRALKRELENTINRAIPGQALLSLFKTIFDPTIREGIGANLPGISRALPAAINPVTGEPLEPRQRVAGVELPTIGGTPIPGATRLLEPVQKLLARYGLLVYRGPRAPIAGYPPGQVPEELRREWQEAFGHFRNRMLTPLARYALMEHLSRESEDRIRKQIQERDRVAAEMANREMRRRHGGPRKLPRQETRREQAGPDIFGPPGED